MKIFTIGFTKKSAEEFFDLIKKSGAKRVIDVRLNNTSQLSGFAKQDDLKYFLKELCHIDYLHLLDLAPTAQVLTPYRHKEHNWQQFKQEFLKLLKERQIEKHLDKKYSIRVAYYVVKKSQSIAIVNLLLSTYNPIGQIKLKWSI